MGVYTAVRMLIRLSCSEFRIARTCGDTLTDSAIRPARDFQSHDSHLIHLFYGSGARPYAAEETKAGYPAISDRLSSVMKFEKQNILKGSVVCFDLNIFTAEL